MSHLSGIKRKQTAVYWEYTGEGGTGVPVFEDPVEILVRWEDKQEIYIDADGEEARSSAIVYPAVEVANKGYLFLGDLTDLSSDPSDPREFPAARRIGKVDGSPDLEATGTFWKVYLEGM